MKLFSLTLGIVLYAGFAMGIDSDEAEFKKATDAWAAAPKSPALATYDKAQSLGGRCVRLAQSGSKHDYAKLAYLFEIEPIVDPIVGDSATVKVTQSFYLSPRISYHSAEELRFTPIAVMADGDVGQNMKSTTTTPTDRTYFALRKGDGNPVQFYSRLYQSKGSYTYDTYCYYWIENTQK